MGEDYTRLMHAARLHEARRLRPCLAFADVVGDAVCCHVAHGANTSAVTCAHPILPGPFAAAHGESLAVRGHADQFNRLFASPCRALLHAATQHAAQEARGHAPGSTPLDRRLQKLAARSPSEIRTGYRLMEASIVQGGESFHSFTVSEQD